MKLKKFIATLAVVGMVAGMAVGCGSKEETAKADNGEKTENTSDWDSSMDITIVSREDGSGTRGAFIELFGVEEKKDGEKAKNAIHEAFFGNVD